MVLSLQGCMAVGKTSAARWLEAHDPTLQVSYEDNAAVLAEVRRRGLDKTRWPDYIEIQRLWLQNEVRRWQAAQAYPCTVLDFGAEEIEFYTLHYPRTIGRDWPVEELLAPELAALRRCAAVCPGASSFWTRRTRCCAAAKRGTPHGTGAFSSIPSPPCCPSSGPGLPKRATWTSWTPPPSPRTRWGPPFWTGPSGSAGRNSNAPK